jgi:hypothetical protein
MTAMREAIVLPAMFLTVALLGGLRVADTVRLVPPPLIALVLAMLLLATLVRAGALAPDRLMNAQRAPLENASGILVLIAVFAASAQVFSLLTPELGLLHAVFSACFFVQLVTTLAGVSGRSNLLRSLVVLLGSALVLRFIVLENLYAPDSGTLKRLLTTLIEGASLGTIDYQPHAAATGYVAFCTVVLYMIGLALLPAGGGPVNVRALRPAPGTDLVLLFFFAFGAFGLTAAGCGGSPSTGGRDIRGAETREAALRSARVWRAPSVPVAQADLAANPQGRGSFQPTDEVSCRLVIRKLSGLTPKFHCEMPDGEVLKVKYGASNGELPAEVAGTRLLAALGFGADAMYVVRKVRCAGCSRFPFRSLQCLDITGMKGPCYLFAGDRDVTEFDTVVIERPLAGEEIESGDDEGWAWYELEKIDPAAGGSPRAEVDALRLLAVVLAHWDNKSANQRIICLPGGERPDGRCSTPLAMIHDLGATFGPPRIDLPNWRRLPVWADAATCTVSMKTLPYGGATFPDRRISEGGRLMLLGLLEQLSTEQLTNLFTASRMVAYDHMLAEARSAAAWTQAFQDKVRQIKDAGPCPQ